jgi:class 3 adenylate cyclase/tetratricopeptide (TPR) repeat protein
MTCHACGRPLDPSARFCAGCGTPVVGRCSSCGAPLAGDARFCPSCGAAVGPATAIDATSEGLLEESARERKVATLLFADIVGFTPLGERHDPEVVNAIVASVFDRLAAEVRRYDGTIEKFAGDAMLAVFGVPVAHEDDAERAVRAALEMRTSMSALSGEADRDGRPELKLRIGIETGIVLADLARARDERDLFVTGDAVNTAARLQAAAEAGTIVVGPTTYAATRDVVAYEELGTLLLKGKELPVAAWRVVDVVARRGGIRPRPGIEARLVGRDAELTMLKETVRRAVAEGRPHLVTILGSAGVGKSRLSWELEKYLDGLPDTFHWRKGRCLAYAGASYSALADAIKADARVADDDQPETVAAKLDERLIELAAQGGPDATIREPLRALLALPTDRAFGRDELFEAWRRHLASIARRHPLVLVLEDIHWADEALLDFIEFLARWGDAPIALLCLARHELLERRPVWGGGIPNATTSILEPLDDAQSASLVEGLLDGALPADLRDRIIATAEGNPLFAEELVRMFIDRGVVRLIDGRWEATSSGGALTIPSSVHAVLAARLDALPAEEKRIAQDAAVVGRIFWDVIVAHLRRRPVPTTTDLLRGLRVKELVVFREPSALAGAAEYGFRHVLVRDVAYDSLPKSERAALHAAVAGWAEEQLSARIDDFAELIASHLEAALTLEVDLGATGTDRVDELRKRLIEASLRAARRAATVNALAGVRHWLLGAIEQSRRLEHPARERAALAAEFYDQLWHEPPVAERVVVFGEAIDLLTGLTDPTADDRRLLAHLQAAHAEAVYEDFRADEAADGLRSAIAALESDGPTAERANLLRILGWILWRTDRSDEAIPILERAISEANEAGDARAHRWALHDLGISWTISDRVAEGIDLLEQSRTLAREAGDRQLLLRCFINVPSLRCERGDLPGEVELVLLEGIDIARRDAAYGSLAWMTSIYAQRVLWQQCRLAEELLVIDEWIDASERSGDEHLRAWAWKERAWVQAAQGQFDLARETWAEATRMPARDEQGRAMWDNGFEAILRWPDDPHSAYETMWGLFEEQTTGEYRAWSGLRAMRMAHRVGDRDMLARAASVFVEVTAGRSGPGGDLDRRWARSLASNDDGTELEAIAAEMERLGFRRNALDAYADAALIAARLGRESAAPERAEAITADTGAQPLLGPLPETRWVVVPERAPR